MARYGSFPFSIHQNVAFVHSSDRVCPSPSPAIYYSNSKTAAPDFRWDDVLVPNGSAVRRQTAVTFRRQTDVSAPHRSRRRTATAFLPTQFSLDSSATSSPPPDAKRLSGGGRTARQTAFWRQTLMTPNISMRNYYIAVSPPDVRRPSQTT